MQTLLLARHATPDRTRREIPYDQPPGPPLTPEGESEAAALGAFLLQQGVNLILCSPFERCRRTGEIAAGICGADLEFVDALSEKAQDETHGEVQARVRLVLERAVSLLDTGQTVSLLTHGSPVWQLLILLGLPAEEALRWNTYESGNPLPPAGAWLATRAHPQQPWALELAFTPLRMPVSA
jgi:broad specificity phosphatase PhoE